MTALSTEDSTLKPYLSEMHCRPVRQSYALQYSAARYPALALVLLFACRPAAADPTEAARALAQRLLPNHAEAFVFEPIAPDEGGDVFEIETRDGKVVLRGTTGVAMASALNHYLETYANAEISVFWGNQTELPDPLPGVAEKIRVVSPFQYRYCFNYCCFSYSMAWWDWPDWERAIDWMALHGINLPLAVTGQEAVWQRVCRGLGLSAEELQSFFVGPAYLPFGWMGCIDGWGGPLPQDWIDRHAALQEKILARERELGMKPVLQGFTGHVPAALRTHFPDAQFRQLPSWCGFPGTLFLDPADPLFERVGKLFVEEQTRQFGTDHFYASDTFIEMSPPSDDPAFLEEMGRAVYRAMAAADPEAVWVMQGWLFVNNPHFWKPPQAKAMLGAVPDNRLLLLDLYCEVSPAWQKTEAFYGKPWVWSIIQSFGDQVSLHGGLPQIAEGVQAALASPAHGRLEGMGLLMEGLGHNPVVYDLFSDLAWRPRPIDLSDWAGHYVQRRYGRVDANAETAWQRLLHTAYRTPGQRGSVVCLRPSLESGGVWGSLDRAYDPCELTGAWEALLAGADALGNLDSYQYDLVHVSRQVLADYAAVLQGEIVAAYEARDLAALDAAGGRFLQLLRDMDELLGTRREFLLGAWLNAAKRWAVTEDDKRLYEWNARNQITLWGPADGVLHDYASKQWSGLVRSFYLPRWERFIAALRDAIDSGKPFDAPVFERELQTWEDSWTRGTETYPDTPQGDVIALARRLWIQYKDVVATPDALSLTTGKTATCSAFLPPHAPERANDGWRNGTSRYWATDITTDPAAWWQVDLESAVNLGRVVVVFYYGDVRSYAFVVEVSTDGAAWDTVADYRDNPQRATRNGVTCTFAARPARYVRVTVTSNTENTGRHLVEVMAFAQ